MTTTKKAKTEKPLRECYICGKRRRKAMHPHHVMTIEEDEDLIVWLCAGCHWLVGLLARRKFLADANKLEDLITLARLQARLPDAKSIVKFVETHNA